MTNDRESRLISGCDSWDEFFAAVCALPNTAQQGTAFERLTQCYLQTQPEYQSGLEAVWTLAEVPADVRKELRLTNVDEGIDLVARTREGDFWAIQCKFRADKPRRGQAVSQRSTRLQRKMDVVATGRTRRGHAFDFYELLPELRGDQTAA